MSVRASLPVWISLLVATFVLSACASAGPPRAQGDVCEIFYQRPAWREATERSAKKWGAPISVQMAIMKQESSFRADARPPRKYLLGMVPWGRVSSAYGYSQALDGTWAWYKKDTGRWIASRSDFDDAADFVGWYMSKSREMLGLSMGDAVSQYLAYHEGQGGYRRGTYRKKRWLIGVARKVGATASAYRSQLSRCGGDF
ncbi:MAG: transglycosylase SLT domain-containing protein [Pseudomonadota bacterium]